MTDAEKEFQTALEVARAGREAWEKDPSKANFIIWRDASEVAIKWHRAKRLGGTESDENEDSLAEFDELAQKRAARA